MPKPEKSAVVLKKFLKKFRPDLHSTVDLNDLDFLVIGCTATLMFKMLKVYGKDTSQINPTEFYVCEVFVIIAARMMFHNPDTHEANNTVLLAYCSTFTNSLGKEKVRQRGYEAVALFSHFYENHVKLYIQIVMTMVNYLKQPSYKQLRELLDIFKEIVGNTVLVQRNDDDVLH